MPREVIMPALGMAQDSGVLVSWLKAPGEAVKAGDALMEVETDKATMEVEAQADGYLTDIRAEAGATVPVGDVVAVIAETPGGAGGAEQAAPAPAASPTAADALPEGAEVIMPALGMAQDTGLLVAWHKAAGDAVAADDILLEVETDKSTMEVPAGRDGYVAALLAEAGEDVPVGRTIAIISAGKPDAPVTRSARAETETETETGTATGAAAEAPAPAPAPAAQAPAAVGTAAKAGAEGRPAKALGLAAPRAAGGRLLASPKARRLAAEQGLDLSRLVEAGVPQPYHVADLETLRSLPGAAAAPQAGAGVAAMHLTAEAGAEGLAALLDWIAAETGGRPDPEAVLAGLAAGALRPHHDGALVVAVDSFGQRRLYADPDRGGLGSAPEADGAPALILRDLRGSGVTGLRLGAEAAPVLSLTGAERLTITLECAVGRLAPAEALDLLTGFAGRLDQPLRQLL